MPRESRFVKSGGEHLLSGHAIRFAHHRPAPGPHPADRLANEYRVLSAAIVSIVGQNNGAKKFDRVRECARLVVRYGVYLIGVASVLRYVFANQLVRLFTDDPGVVQIGGSYIRIMTFIQWAYVMTFIHIGFQNPVK